MTIKIWKQRELREIEYYHLQFDQEMENSFMS
jgi:hypothetical protein